MGDQYKQLTLKERIKIEMLHEDGHSAREIAEKLKRSNASISKELRPYKDGQYCAEIAHHEAQLRRQSASKFTKCTEAVRELTHAFLTLGFSPEQISGRMTMEGVTQAVSCNTLYNFVKKLGWQHRLARKGKPYRKKTPVTAGVKLIPNRVDISERPAIVDEKKEVGHWEGDTVYGQDGYFVTMVERVSKILVTVRVKNKTKKEVTKALIKMMKPYRSLCKTITFDNGGEFAGHAKISKALKCSVYFAKPYHSWERGLNENTNGLLRRMFPKGMCFSSLTTKEIERAQILINMRPRKTLNYLSPYEFLTGKRVSLIAAI